MSRKQDDLTRRINGCSSSQNGRAAQRGRSANGLDLRRVAAFLTILGEDERGAKLDAIGARLREIGTRETYLDGGRSQQAIVDDLRAANHDLQAINDV